MVQPAPQDVREHAGVAVRGVAGAEQDRDTARSREPAQLGEPLTLLLQLGTVAPVELVEALRHVPVPATKLVAGRKLARPHVDRSALTSDPARPQPINQNPEAVIRRGWIVDALLANVDDGACHRETDFTQSD